METHQIHRLIVDHCLGSWSENNFEIDLDRVNSALPSLSPISCAWDAKLNKILPASKAYKYLSYHDGKWTPCGESPPNIGRTAVMINRLRNWAETGVYIIDLWDAREFENINVPIFCYNRRKQSREIILVPLPGHHDKGGKGFFKKDFHDNTSFSEKSDSCCWRGALTGRASLRGFHGEISGLIESTLKNYCGISSDHTIYQLLIQNPRFNIVNGLCGFDFFDVGFVPLGKYKVAPTYPLLKRLYCESLDHKAQAGSKYLLAISGNDVASSLYWQLQTNSMVLKLTCPYEIFIDCLFRDKDHYLEVSPDPLSVLSTISACQGNQVDSHEMIKSRLAYVTELLQLFDLNMALRLLVQEYEKRFIFVR